jgi:hypothetical protein
MCAKYTVLLTFLCVCSVITEEGVDFRSTIRTAAVRVASERCNVLIWRCPVLWLVCIYV